MANNMFQEQITPDKPKILQQERIFVYVPKATTTTQGIASFDDTDFRLNNGKVYFKKNDPRVVPSLIKILADPSQGGLEYTDDNIVKVQIKTINSQSLLGTGNIVIDLVTPITEHNADPDAHPAIKQNVADNTSARHTHLNKAILDSTTASYTIEEQTKLGAISGTNTGDQILPVNSDFTLSGLSEKNFSSLTEKPTTLEGYGITDGLNSSLKGANNGLAELDATGKVPSGQLPGYVDDVIEVANYASLPVTGEDGKIYVTLDTNLTYRWGGTVYVEISPSLALGETSSTAYRGDNGKTAYDHSQLTSGNPHNVTKSNVGLSNVYNPTAYGGISYGGGAGESGVSFTDLNSLAYTGFYTCYGTTANVPSASYSWFIQHINSNVGNVSATQTAIAYGTTNIIYKRNKSSSTWSAWENISPSLKENLTNKVTSISSSSTDTQYPSAKCVYDIVGDIESLLAEV